MRGGFDLARELAAGLADRQAAWRFTRHFAVTVAAWKDARWPVVKGRRRTWGRGCASKTRPAGG